MHTSTKKTRSHCSEWAETCSYRVGLPVPWTNLASSTKHSGINSGLNNVTNLKHSYLKSISDKGVV